MTAIRVVCRSCGSEVNSAEVDRDMRCVRCLALTLIEADLQEYGRLWAKAARYMRSTRGAGLVCVVVEMPGGASKKLPASIAGQLSGLARRMSKRLHERITNTELAAETLNAALERARQRADSSGGRILVPRVGQEIVGTGARA